MDHISPQEFTEFVSLSQSWSDLAPRCGQPLKFGRFCSTRCVSALKQKVLSMRLDTQHFTSRNTRPEIADDAALMKMEVAGICGTDVKLYAHPPMTAPCIMGHENIGYIAKCGKEFTRRKGFKEGDLVFVEHYVMCGKCEHC
jgi:hypothetical protein